jgi:Protein of unknown function (DUF2569)/GYF domain 2
MSDVWYYAGEREAVGPMSLDDLVRAISVMHEPREAIVWRAGFAGWEKAVNVSEVAQRAFRPPPFPPPPIPRRLVAEPVRIEPGLRLKVEPLPIGGWLVFVALGQTFGPIRLVYWLIEYYSTLDWSIAQRFPAAFVGEAVFNVVYIALAFVTMVLFWRRSRAFPRFFVYETIATLAFLPLGAAWVAATMSASSEATFNDLFAQAFDPKETGRTIAAGIGGCLWIWYLYKSKRVAKTFIR